MITELQTDGDRPHGSKRGAEQVSRSGKMGRSARWLIDWLS